MKQLLAGAVYTLHEVARRGGEREDEGDCEVGAARAYWDLVGFSVMS